MPIVISSPYLIPSSRFNNARYPPSLSRHLLSLTLSRPSTMRRETDQPINASPNSAEHTGTVQPPIQSAAPLPSNPSTATASSPGGSGATFLGMPTVSINMDVRKWSWPGVLSFGKTQGRNMHGQVHDEIGPEPKTDHNSKEGNTEATQAVPVDVDTSSLEDAMASDARSVAASSVLTNQRYETGPDLSSTLHYEGVGESETMAEDHLSSAEAAYQPAFSSPSCVSLGNEIPSSGASISSSFQSETPLTSQTPLPTPAPEFMSTMVHLPVGDDSLVTKWRKVLYLGVRILFHAVLFYRT